MFNLTLHPQRCLLFPKLETPVHWTFCYSTWSLGSIWLEARFFLKLAAPAVSLASYLGSAKPVWIPGCWELALKGTQGPPPTGHCTCLCSQCEVTCQGWNGGSGRKRVPPPHRREFWLNPDFESDIAFLAVQENCSLTQKLNGEKGDQCAGYHAVSLLSFLF